MKIIIIEAVISLDENTLNNFYTFTLTSDPSPAHAERIIKEHLLQHGIDDTGGVAYAILDTPAPPESMTIEPVNYGPAIIKTVEKLTKTRGLLDSMALGIIEELTHFLHAVSRANKPGSIAKSHQIDQATALLPYDLITVNSELSLDILMSHNQLINELMANLGIRFRMATPQTIVWSALDTDDSLNTNPNDDDQNEIQALPPGIVIH